MAAPFVIATCDTLRGVECSVTLLVGSGQTMKPHQKMKPFRYTYSSSPT